MPSVDFVLDRLAEAGCRGTGARRAVVEVIADQSTSFTAQDIQAVLDRRGVGRATVFRTLNLLTDLGLLNRLYGEDGCHRYTLCEPVHHHHFICRDCGQVFPLDTCLPEAAVEQAASAIGFEVTGHHVEVYGHCAACLPA